MAAGTSSRMGDKNKMGLSYQGKPFLVHAVEQLLLTDVTRITVVAGHEAHWAATQLSAYAVDLVINRNYLQGQLSSLQLGLQHLLPTCQNWLVTLADMPLLTSVHYQKVMDLYYQENASILVPHNGQFAGHPKIFAASFVENILKLSPADHQGAKAILRQYADQITFFRTQEEAYFFDVDTPDAYQKLIDK